MGTRNARQWVPRPEGVRRAQPTLNHGPARDVSLITQRIHINTQRKEQGMRDTGWG